jgi:4-diphosphocytidyl-2-C-methyl-D-erythritol kinase
MIVRKAPAKVNLWLKICGKRADGFHELDSLFVPLTLADEVLLEKKERGISLVVQDCGTGEAVPRGPENLAWRAAEAFFCETQIAVGAAITLKKKIPSGAGLGGGSSDAAAVLLGLEELYGFPLEDSRRRELALGLGSDVPFFLLGTAARGRGRGEILEPCPSPWRGDLLLCKPPFGVSTPWAYREFERLARTASPGDGCGEPELWRNDLEAPVFSKFLVLPDLGNWLRARPGVRAVMMCGSGSTLLAALDNPSAVPAIQQDIAIQFGPTFWTCLTKIF